MAKSSKPAAKRLQRIPRIEIIPADSMLKACMVCANPCPPKRTVCAVCAPEQVITALARCAAALCFGPGGPKMDSLTAKLCRGKAPKRTEYLELIALGWIEWKNGWRLSSRGTEIYIALHESFS